MKKSVVTGTLFLSIMALLACNSKFSEPSPEEVKIDGMKLDDRLAHKAQMDSKIEQIQKSTEKMKRIIEIFRNARSEGVKALGYTPIDLVIDVNAELKKRIPQEYQGKSRRYGTIELPSGLVSEECRTVNTILETQPKVDIVTYYLKTCTSGDYFKVAEVQWQEYGFDINVNNDNLGRLFADLFKHEVERGSCLVNTDGGSNITSVTCKNIETEMNKYEHVVFTEMGYFLNQEITFSATAVIYNSLTGKKKTTLKLEVPKSGGPNIDVLE